MIKEKENKNEIENLIFYLDNNNIVNATIKYPICFNKEENEEEEEVEEKEKKFVNINFNTKYKNKLILHWGVYPFNNSHIWTHPSKDYYPLNTIEKDNNALQTEFLINEKDKESHSIFLTLPYDIKKESIGGINFVFFNPDNNIWYNNNHKDYKIKFKTPPKKINLSVDDNINIIPDFIQDIIKIENSNTPWTLTSRYNKCSDIIENFLTDNYSINNWSYLLIYLQFSFQRKLTWQRGEGRPVRPNAIAKSLKRLTGNIVSIYGKILFNEKKYINLIYSISHILKKILSFLGKGTGDGEKVRWDILKILQKNGLWKGGRFGTFYRQWHQKLHNNSSPDDVYICEALIKFLKTNDINQYWEHLNKNGITKEILASYDRKITLEPFYNASFLPDFEYYLTLLKSVYSSNDMCSLYNECKNNLNKINNESNKIFEEIIKNKENKQMNNLNKIKQITEGRKIIYEAIINNLNDIDVLRDLLFFEINLENYLRQLIESIIHIQKNYEEYLEYISIILNNLIYSYPNFIEIKLCYEDWLNIVMKIKNIDDKYNALKIKSVLSRLSILLSNVIDFYNNVYDNRVKYLGKELKIDNFYCNVFTEELIRGSMFFILSILIKKIEPSIRKNAELNDWLIISRGKIKDNYGKLFYIKNLHDVQFEKYKEKNIIVTEVINGEEEIPFNCEGLIIIKNENYPDILSHVSVRARNLNIPFIVCFNEDISNTIYKLVGNYVNVKIINQNCEVIKTEHIENIENDNKNDKNVIKLNLKDVGEKYEKIYLEIDEFTNNNVGAKSLNTKKIYNKIELCPWLKYPESFSIPFNIMEFIINLEENKNIKEKINTYIKNLSTFNNNNNKTEIINILENLKKLILKLNFPKNNNQILLLSNKLESFGIKNISLAFNAIKKVWASKFNQRVYLASNKLNISLNQIKISVLCQKIIPAEYAFVIHTKNPSNNNENELYCEIVKGMGETLVGSYQGQSFSFVFDKNKKNYQINTYSNKIISLLNEGFIFRSDSNFEDLEGFSGAGLFDSFCINNYKIINNCWYNDKLFMNKDFIENMINKISELGINVEKYFNEPQDIEGVYYNEEFYIVQTRPQV